MIGEEMYGVSSGGCQAVDERKLRTEIAQKDCQAT